MELAKFFKALSDESRFKLFKLLLTHDFCVGALAYTLKISEAAVSQHLKQLREAGLVRGEKKGYWTHYRADGTKLGEVAEALKDLAKLPPCSEGLCRRELNLKTDLSQESKTICNCRCHHPQELNGKPHECNPRQADRDHGSIKSHPCVPRTKKRVT